MNDVENIKTEIITDKRGFNIFAKIKGRKIMVSYTEKGYYRGGDYHNVPQLFMVLKRSVFYKIKEHGKERSMVLKAGQSYIAPRRDPHIIKAREDTIFIEAFLGKDTTTFYYDDYRKLVKK